MKQLHERTAFEPEFTKDMTPEERKQALETLTFIEEKRD